MKTMLITGVSSGLGRALAAEALRQGWRVAGTVRKEEDRAAFEASRPGQAFARLLDVRDAARTTEVVREIEQTVGPIDVLVNNAGYGLWSTIEEAPLDEIREQFAVNVLGQVAMLQAVLPGMRTRRAGRVLNITSMGGLTAFPLVGIYNATKFAMEGITGGVAAGGGGVRHPGDRGGAGDVKDRLGGAIAAAWARDGSGL